MKERRLNGNRLKLIAVISMVCDHAAFALLAPWLSLPALYAALRSFGRIAFPAFVSLLVEGAFFTRSRKRYAARLAVFALLSELPFDWLSGNLGAGTAQCFRSQNVMFTLLLSLLQTGGLIRIQSRFGAGGEPAGLLQALWVAVCAAAAWLIRSDYGAYGLVLAAIFYRFRWRPPLACALGFVWMAVTCAAFRWYYCLGYAAAFVLLAMYDGTRDDTEQAKGDGSLRSADSCGRMRSSRSRCETFPRLRRYAWYFFYPAHMLALCLFRLWLFR